MSFDRAAGKTGNVPVGDARQCPTALRDRPPALSQHQSHRGRAGGAGPHCPHSLLDALLHGQSRRHLTHARPQGVKRISLTTWPRAPNGPWSFPLSITRTPPALPSVSAIRSWAFHLTRSRTMSTSKRSSATPTAPPTVLRLSFLRRSSSSNCCLRVSRSARLA